MVIELPARLREGVGGAEPLEGLDLPIAVRRRLPLLLLRAQRHRRTLTLGVLAFAVLAFSGAWTGGALVLDSPGMSLHLRIALDHLGADRTVPYWVPDIWAGAPLWTVIPTLPIFLLLPLATIVGADAAVKLGVLGLQVFGACGAVVLARSLWENRAAAIVAGVLFGLQPLLVSHGALIGNEPAVGVMAAAPWLAWSLRKGLRGEGTRYVILAGLLAGFAVLMQAEYAIGLAVMCVCLVAVEAGRVGTGRNETTPAELAGRAGAVLAIALGSAAYWLLPFLNLRRSFAVSPPELVRRELFTGSSAGVAREVGRFFGRAGELSGAVGFTRPDVPPVLFRLGWVCLALTLVTVAVVARRDRDGTLTAILLSSAVGIWLSTGAVSLASSGPAQRTQVVPFVVAGLAAGLLLGALLRPMRLGRLAPLFLAAAVAFLVAVPYLTPFVTLQKLLPVFENLDFPRVYSVAPLALALGAAYPVVLAQEWARDHRARTAPAALPHVLAVAVAFAVVGLFLVDVWPSRSYYRLRPPSSGAAYREVVANLSAAPGDFRVAPTQLTPSAVENLLDTDRPQTVGWPYSAAGRQVWRLTAEPLSAPNAYRERAYGLSATAYQVVEKPTDRGTAAEAVPAIDLVRNPRALPMVRAYTHTIAMADREITPELAVGLAHRNVGVFTGSPGVSPALAATTVVDVRSSAPCADDSGARLDPGLASQLGVACGLHAWLGTLLTGVDLVNVGDGVGAVFDSTTDRLQGISAYLDRPPDRAEVALHEVVPGGRSLGPELARGKAVGVDENGLAAFTFDPVAGSAGKEYAFVLTCPGCPADRVPRLVVGHSVGRPANLIVAGTLRPDRAAAFTPIYEPVAADPPAGTTVEPSRTGSGKWRIGTTGSQPSLIVVAEAWFPGWKARVDGRRAPVVEADGGFVGVPVDAGSHVVTLERRRPVAATAGRLVTIATLLSLAALAIRRRRVGPRPFPPANVAAPPSAPKPSVPPLLPARVRPRVEPERPSDEPEWDEVVNPRRSSPSGGPGRERPPRGEKEGGREPPRRPGTARWPPEPT